MGKVTRGIYLIRIVLSSPQRRKWKTERKARLRPFASLRGSSGLLLMSSLTSNFWCPQDFGVPTRGCRSLWVMTEHLVTKKCKRYTEMGLWKNGENSNHFEENTSRNSLVTRRSSSTPAPAPRGGCGWQPKKVGGKDAAITSSS